jgi:glycine cleavage system transcriptional repressor
MNEVSAMNKLVISVLGPDRPGIIAAVTRVLFEADCNIENVSQTILQNEFSGIFIVLAPEALTAQDLGGRLKAAVQPLGMKVYVKCLEPGPPQFESEGAERFVITTKGPDAKGLVASITAIIAEHGVNVTNLQAVFKGGDNPFDNIMIYEVDIPRSTDQASLYSELRAKAGELQLDISIQHRNIFEAINRV